MKKISGKLWKNRYCFAFALLAVLIGIDIYCPGTVMAITPSVFTDPEAQDFPFVELLAEIQQSLTGEIAKAVACIFVVYTGMEIAAGEGGPSGRTVGKIVVGLGLLFGAPKLIEMMLSSIR